jgi:hypothetical protein
MLAIQSSFLIGCLEDPLRRYKAKTVFKRETNIACPGRAKEPEGCVKDFLKLGRDKVDIAKLAGGMDDGDSLGC